MHKAEQVQVCMLGSETLWKGVQLAPTGKEALQKLLNTPRKGWLLQIFEGTSFYHRHIRAAIAICP